MSESAEDKTKRKFIKALNTYKPTYQMSICMDKTYHRQCDIDLFAANIGTIKRKVNAVSNTPTIYWLQTKYVCKGTILPMIIMLFTDKPNIKTVTNIIEDTLLDRDTFRVIFRRYTQQRLESRIRAIKAQKLHDLVKGFGVGNFKRFSVANKAKLSSK